MIYDPKTDAWSKGLEDYMNSVIAVAAFGIYVPQKCVR
jgi:hypothetical protein